MGALSVIATTSGRKEVEVSILRESRLRICEDIPIEQL